MPARSKDERASLERRIRELEEENLLLRMKTQDIASANVNAAMQLVELTEERSRELELKNREIMRALDLAEEASQQKSRFLATMSHELRTPISGIIGMAELLAAGELSSVQRDRVQAIANTAESFLDLVNQMLDYSKAEVDAIEVEQIEFDLWRVNEAVAQLLYVSAQEKNVDLVFDLDPSLPREVVGDPLRIRQVALNLGFNAVKFTSRGVVGFSVRRRVDHDGSEWIEWLVDDTGCGFDEKIKDRLFEPFTQADASTARKYGGTGLGLAISRHLVRAMGGHIEAASEPDKGSTFTVRLPLQAVDEAVDVRVPDRVARVIAARPSTQSMLAGHLPLLGYRVIAADDPTPADLLAFEPASDARVALAELRKRFPSEPAVVVACPGAPIEEAEYASMNVLGVLQLPPRPTVLAGILACQREGGDDEQRGDRDRYPGRRVLVADDTEINLVVAREQLRFFGCEVVTAIDGQQAVDKFRAGSFDLVLLDCQMPVLDGYDAAAQMRRFERSAGRARTPILAVTADGSPASEARCQDVGMDGFVSKPLRRAQLAELLEHWSATVG
ncbi:MAG TPA: response regulator [bacterium]|nr:response regulator [bacterium]